MVVVTVVVVVPVMASGVRSASGWSNSVQYGLHGSTAQMDPPRLPASPPSLPEPASPAPESPPDPASPPLIPVEHAPPTHICPAGQRKPHEPQFVMLLVVSTHMLLQLPNPFAQQRLLSQIPLVHTTPQAPQLPVSDDVSEQTPPQQVSPLGQTLPHAPQLLGSLVGSIQRPLQAVPPFGQGAHAPLLQRKPAGHLLPQAPQLLLLV